MPYPKGYLTSDQVRRLKKIPVPKKSGPPNLAEQVRGINKKRSAEEDLFIDSDDDVPASQSSVDSFVTALSSESEYYTADEEEEDTLAQRTGNDPYGIPAKRPPNSRPPPDSPDPPAYHIRDEVPTETHHIDKRSVDSMSGKRSAAAAASGGASTSDAGDGAPAAKAARVEPQEASSDKSQNHRQHVSAAALALDNSFGSYTTPEGQHFTTYRKTYSKTFKSYCKFDGVKKANVNTKAGQTDVTVTINHGGHTFPYWRRNASTCEEDFHQPPNVIGFRCATMGFNVRRMEVAVCPNDRTSDHEVPMTPPTTTQMWMFVDTNKDYGVPQIHQTTNHDTSFGSHNYDFNNYHEGEIPTMPDRLQVWDKQMLLELNRTQNSYNHTTDVFTTTSPYDIYDLKRHPGYRELDATEATSFSMDYSPTNTGFTFFPHRQVADLSGYRGATGIRKDEDMEKYTDTADLTDMVDWPINFIHTDKAHKRVKSSNDGQTISQLHLAYLQQKSGRNGKMDNDNLEFRQPMQQYTYHKTGSQDMLVFNPAYDSNNGSYTVSEFLVKGVSPDGKVQDCTDRPPYFMFGIHPDFERKASGIHPYNYFANVNVTYYSVVEWLIATPTPSYIPLGPAGCMGLTHDKVDFKKNTALKKQQQAKHAKSL
ncbi:hypothetical protein ElyMa_000467900 [Elysia marginata]|uniref:Uncharacterized protein n=1 Tax=Elysia marginata TaxID=1093978 RepID=A0AAV4FS11_9GAST|nr:hypothetical protein ElyMa_000467900 [Elysia marginata]